MDTPDYTRRLLRLLEVCRNLSASLTLEPLLHTIIEVASELTQSEASAVLLEDPEHGILKFAAAPWYLMDGLRDVAISRDASLAGKVFTAGQPLLLHVSDADPDLWRLVDGYLVDGPRSWLGIPILLNQSAVGVMVAVNKANDAHYFEDDVFVMDTLASQVAAAVQRQRLTDCVDAAGIARRELERLKADFAAIASHELRTPLGLIIGHTTLLMDELTGEQREQAAAVLRGAERMHEVVEQLADVSGISRSKSVFTRAAVVVVQAVEEVVADFQDLAQQRQIELTANLPPEKLVWVGDGEQLRTVLGNLVKNALTFTNEGGVVQVKAEGLPGFIKFTVADTGIGIPAGEQEKIFERFYQVEKHLTRRHGGMGLGLAIARDIVESQSGRIWVESEEGQGSRFMFALPVDDAQAQAAGQVFRS